MTHKLMIAVPNMLRENTYLTRRLFEYTSDKRFEIGINWITEQRFHDNARNQAVKSFLGSKFEWLLQLDDDTCPHPKLLDLVERGKRVVTGVVFCFIKGNLMPSIWRCAECEMCANVGDFKDGKETRDKEYYRVVSNVLERWNPWKNTFEPFYHKETGFLPGKECRCKGTGMDPWVFRCHPGAFNPQEPFFRCDSMGGAALLVHRSVYEELEYPWFQFLFRHDRQILLTEDHYFAWTLRERGIEIWCDNQMPSNHFKTMDLLMVNQLMVKAMQLGAKEEAKKHEESRIIVPKVAMGVVG